jgi:hypothetical protein
MREGKAVGVAMGYVLDGLGSIPSKVKVVSIVHCVQTCSGVQRVPGALPRRRSVRGVNMTTYLHLVPRLRMVELFLHSTIDHNDSVFEYRDNLTLPYLALPV